MRKISTPLVNEINITPFTDVILVLLIIFMIASPFLQVEEEEGEELRVPQVETAVPLGEAEHLLVMMADGSLILDDNPIDKVSLSPILEKWADDLKASGEVEGLKLYIAAEEEVTWKDLAEVMSIAKISKVERLGMVEELVSGDVTIAPGEADNGDLPVS